MKTRPLFRWILLSAIFLSGNLSAQFSSPVSSHSANQIVQGPCYIFATVAAIEAKGLAQGTSVNISEWFLYSECVNNSDGGFGMMQNVLDQLSGQGGLREENFPKPSFGSSDPNDICAGCSNIVCDKVNDMTVPCEYVAVDEKGNTVEICGEDCLQDVEREGDFTRLAGTGIDIVKISNVQKISESLTGMAPQAKILRIKEIMEENNSGVVLYLSDYLPERTSLSEDGCGRAHSIYVHGWIINEEGKTEWRFKDSWPCAATSGRSQILDMINVTNVFVIKASVSLEPSCGSSGGDCVDITGPEVITTGGSYIVNVPLTQFGSNYQWTVSNGLTINGLSNKKNISVRVSPCAPSTATISVSYDLLNGAHCEDTLVVTIDQDAELQTPSIEVLSLDWNNGATCPNTILELNAIYPGVTTGLTFEWQISGATIIGGQGTDILFVKTWDTPANVPLLFKVRVVGECDTSEWASITGTSSPNNCRGGGGQYRLIQVQQNDGDSFVLESEEVQSPINYQLFDLSGRLVASGQLASREVKNMSELSNGIYLLRIEQDGIVQTNKLVKY